MSLKKKIKQKKYERTLKFKTIAQIRSKVCDKKSFLDEESAKAKIKEIKAEDGDEYKRPIRTYKCNLCGNFHLTSWSKKKKKLVEKFIQQRVEKQRVLEANYYAKKYGWELIDTLTR